MTKVRFTFVDVQGNPLPLMEFKILLRRASFNAEDVGVALPEELKVTTDAAGQVIVELWPLKAAYRVQIAEEYEELCGKLNWSFYVPQSDHIVEAQTLFLVPPPNNIPWDEEAIGKINQAVLDTKESAEASEASAVRAEEAANSVAGDAEDARQAAISAKADAEIAAEAAELAQGAIDTTTQNAEAARLSAEQALANKQATDVAVATTTQNAESAAASEQSATTASQTASEKAAIAVTAAQATAVDAASALNSKDAAKLSENAAKASETVTVAAAAEAVAAKEQVATDAATASAAATAADVSEQAASASASSADADATQTAQDRISVTQSAQQVSTDAAQVALDRASSEQAAIEASSSAGTALTQANRAQTEADRAASSLAGKQDANANLTALAGLVGAADRLPYFTGAGALSLSVLTAKARALLSRADTAAMWVELALGSAAGLTATTSTSDTTDGRVARIGDHGLGSQVSPLIADMDLPVANGYSWVTSGTSNPIVGFASGSQVLTFFASAAEIAQMYFSRTTPMRIGTRRKTAGAWQAGTDLVTTAGAILDPSLNTGGILSTSVVSGFRVDKYINGTMCVTGKVALPSIAANVYPYQTLTLPVTFFNTANMVPLLSCNASTSADSYGVVFQRAASTSSVLYAIRNGATAQTFEVNVCVWGTWK